MLAWGAILAVCWIVLMAASVFIERRRVNRLAAKLIDESRQVAGFRVISMLSERQLAEAAQEPRWFRWLGVGTILLALASLGLLFSGAFAWAASISSAWLRWLALYAIAGTLVTALHMLGRGSKQDAFIILIVTVCFWPLVAILKLMAPYPGFEIDPDQAADDDDTEVPAPPQKPKRDLSRPRRGRKPLRRRDEE